MTLTRTHVAFLLASAGLVAGCGGGGGGGGGTPPPPPPSTMAAITAANGFNVALLANAFLEAPVQLSLSALDAIFDLNDAGTLSEVIDCRRVITQGTVTATLSDNDGNLLLSAGDVITLDYVGCFQDGINDEATGQVRITLESLTIASDGSSAGSIRFEIPSQLIIDSGNGDSVTVSGGFSLAFALTPSVDDMTISMLGTDEFTVVIQSGSVSSTEFATNMNQSRRLDSTAGYAISASLDIDSQLLGGEVECATTADITGSPNLGPDAGTLRCTGRSGSQMRVVALNPNAVRNEVDPEGDGTFSDLGTPPNGNGLWFDYVEGTLFSTRVDLPTVERNAVIPEISSTMLALEINDVVVDEANDLLFVVNDAGLSVVDAATMTVSDSLAMTDRPSAVAISDDGSTLWIGFTDATEMVSVDVATLTPGAREPLGVTVQNGFDRFVEQIRVVPGTTTSVVVTITSNNEVLAFDDGVLRTNIVEDFLAPTIFEFRDATTIIGVDDSISSFPTSIITLDANGVTLDKQIEDYSQNFNSIISLEGDRVWASSGRVFDPFIERIDGRVDFDQLGESPFRHAVLVNAADQRAYFYEPGGDILDFYDTSTLTASGAYRVRAAGSFMRRMLEAGNGDIILATDSELHRVQRSLLTNTLLARRCITTDLGGQLGPAVFIQIECNFNDSVYDSQRDLIYASVPSAAGPDGNSIAIINPATGNIQSFIFVGSEPTDLSMSGSGNRLFVVLGESNTIAEVDLQTQSLAQLRDVANESTFGGPQLGVAVSASPLTETEVLISTERETGYYISGTQAANVGDRTSQPTDIFLKSDGARAYVYTLGRDIYTFDVDATGLTNEIEERNSLLVGPVKFKNDLLYGRGGRTLDPDTLGLTDICSTTIRSGVEPDPDNSLVYFFFSAFDSEITVCDETTGTTGAPFIVPRFGDNAAFKTLTKAGANRIAITGNTRMLLLDPSEF